MDTCARATPARLSLKLTVTLGVLAVAAIPAAILLAQPGGSPFTVVETGKGYASLQQAVDAIGAGEGTIAIASGTYRQCAVQEGGSVSYFAAEPGKAVFEGETCEGTFELTAGDYVLFCALVEEEGGTLESHYEEGMVTTFTVS